MLMLKTVLKLKVDRPHNKVGNLAAALLRPFVKGEKNGETRIIVARRKEIE